MINDMQEENSIINLFWLFVARLSFYSRQKSVHITGKIIQIAFWQDIVMKCFSRYLKHVFEVNKYCIIAHLLLSKQLLLSVLKTVTGWSQCYCILIDGTRYNNIFKASDLLIFWWITDLKMYIPACLSLGMRKLRFQFLTIKMTGRHWQLS